MVTAIKCNDYLNHVDVGDLVHNRDLMVHTSVYYGPHPCVLRFTLLCTMVHTPVYYGPHPCTMVHTPVYYGGGEGEGRGEVHPGLGEGIWGSTNPPPPPHPCVLWSTPLCTMVHTPVYYGPHPCVLWRRRG